MDDQALPQCAAPSEGRNGLALLAAIGTYGAAQGLSAAVARMLRGRSTRRQYQGDVALPSFAPPGQAFPLVWSVLNVTTATSAWRLWRAGSRPASDPALLLWLAAVPLRSAYVPLAFGRRWWWPATGSAALLSAALASYAAAARRTSRTAAVLALPEVGWTAFATVLSAAVARRNS